MHRPLLKPPRLEFGDTVSLIAPSSPPLEPKRVDASIAALEALGFKVKPGRHVRARKGFLAGTDRERAGDIMNAFTDQRSRAIFCVRGGYGTPRLMHLLDYNLIRKHPKIFVGYSDITALHCAFLKHSGLISFHGPMLASDLAKNACPKFTVDALLRTIMHPDPAGSIRLGYRRKSIRVIRSGRVSGRLLGGNLLLLCTIIGTPHEPDFRDRILFFEDLNEPPYRIDRMLTHLLNAGLLQKVAGVAAGIFAKCDDPDAKKLREYRQSLPDVLEERLRPLKVPVVTGLPFGHIPFNCTLPLGVPATLDADAGDLIVDEGGVV